MLIDSLASALREVRYDSHLIHLTEQMQEYSVEGLETPQADFYSQSKYKMAYASSICQRFDDSGALARIGIQAIRNKRAQLTDDGKVVPEKTAYIIRQFKRPEEIRLLRQVYGKQFILISAYGSEEQRRRHLELKVKTSVSTSTSPAQLARMVEDLLTTDAAEAGEVYGQQLRETFHLADVFVDGFRRGEMDEKVVRFIHALFGRTDISPSKDEYGMYAAKSASLRSADLSRQVGAAVFSADGELITQGCNEAPKAFGGTYWDLEEPDFRDVRLGYDPNEREKGEILRDLVDRLSRGNMLSKEAIELGSPADIVEALTSKATKGKQAGALVGATILDLTEYGRIVHAEMCAICDAARLGRPLKGAILYCTTFPCHNCTKHILAAGIRKVVYMEPYPKSRAKDLHENEIQIEKSSETRVSFMPFLGISPFRYRDIFQKGKRKGPDGHALRWYWEEPRPMLDLVTAYHIETEDAALASLLGSFEPVEPEDAADTAG